ncbi:MULTISPECIES: DUF6059 family protein [Streptomyces]|uniref:DUF6059 family protein n=1 Tax=Streptomyces TaxID=1883 RepID=UPI0033B52890
MTSSTPGNAAHGRPGFGLDLVKRLFRTAYWSLSDFGWVWLGGTAPPAGEPVPRGPHPGHPERLSGLPLTEVERALERRLAS